MYGESDCANFLLHHVITFNVSLLAVNKIVSAEAEVMVGKQINQAQVFCRALGEWFAKSGSGRIGEKELRRLAGRYDLGLKAKKDELMMSRGSHGLSVRSLSDVGDHISDRTVVLA